MTEKDQSTNATATATDTDSVKYSDALARLQEIVEQIESTQIDVDDLELVVLEAVGLISLCRAKLTGAQTAVEQALSGLKSD